MTKLFKSSSNANDLLSLELSDSEGGGGKFKLYDKAHISEKKNTGTKTHPPHAPHSPHAPHIKGGGNTLPIIKDFINYLEGGVAEIDSDLGLDGGKRRKSKKVDTKKVSKPRKSKSKSKRKQSRKSSRKTPVVELEGGKRKKASKKKVSKKKSKSKRPKNSKTKKHM